MPSCKVDIKMSYPTFADNKYTDMRDSLVKSIALRIYSAPLDDFFKRGVKAHLEKQVEEQVEDYKLDLEQAKSSTLMSAPIAFSAVSLNTATALLIPIMAFCL